VKKNRSLLLVTRVQGYPLRDLPRLLWALWKFQHKFNKATPEQQERAMAVLKQGGAREVRRDR
jgi:hypothetical protein